MKKLEKKILKKVYAFETKRTLFELIFRIGSIIAVITAGFFVILNIIKQLIEQQTLDLFQLFKEDTETIRRYIGEVTHTFYEELPKFESIIVIVLGVIFIILLLIFIQNFEKIRNKIQALKRYWLKR